MGTCPQRYFKKAAHLSIDVLRDATSVAAFSHSSPTGFLSLHLRAFSLSLSRPGKSRKRHRCTAWSVRTPHSAPTWRRSGGKKHKRIFFVWGKEAKFVLVPREDFRWDFQLSLEGDLGFSFWLLKVDFRVVSVFDLPFSIPWLLVTLQRRDKTLPCLVCWKRRRRRLRRGRERRRKLQQIGESREEVSRKMSLLLLLRPGVLGPLDRPRRRHGSEHQQG